VGEECLALSPGRCGRFGADLARLREPADHRANLHDLARRDDLPQDSADGRLDGEAHLVGLELVQRLAGPYLRAVRLQP
jgi:hypothetical protein